MKIHARLVVFTVCLLFLAATAAPAQAQLTWETNSNGTITVTGGCPSSPGAVTVPNTIDGLSVTGIGEFAFYNCSSLISLTIPDSVTDIGLNAFLRCTSLLAIDVDPANPRFSSLEGVLFDKDRSTLLACPGGKASSYVVPKTVATIREYAFAGCRSLGTVEIPDEVRHIEGFAFAGCESLTNVTIPASVTSIRAHTFASCINLAAVSIPEGVTAIGEGAFLDCHRLAKVVIPSSVASIGWSAFEACMNLSSVTVPDRVASIPAYAFSYCKGLTNIVMPGSLTQIGGGAFRYCASLTALVVPGGVTILGAEAFLGCTALTSVYFEGNSPSVDPQWPTFGGADRATVYYLPGTTGWGPSLHDRPTALWVRPQPTILTHDSRFGPQTNGFSFVISWATNATVVVDVSPTLANPIWSPVSTHTLTDGTAYYSDPQWASHQSRFYRVRQQ